MKKLLLVLLAVLPFAMYAQETLTNNDIIKLSKLGLPSSAVISKIKNSATHFDVGVDALVLLKKEGVSAEVISEMIDAATKEQKEMASHKDYNDPKTMRKTGIYYYNKSEPSNLFVPVDATVVSNSKSGGFGTALAQRYTAGIAANKNVSSLSGAQSHRQIPHANPKFYFYFEGNNTLTPNEFALVRLVVKKSTREVVVGSSNAYGGKAGVSDKQKVDFNYEQVADGIYRVYAKEPFEPGEYCFMYVGSAPTLFSGDKVYDFSITDGGN